MLALTGAGASGIILWAIGYFLYGFFVVFRVILFADMADREGLSWLACGGLLFGRIGDALGTALCVALESSPVTLVLVTAALFAVSAALLFSLYRRLFVTTPDDAPEPSPARDVLGEFCVAYGLSAREREVLPLLVAGRTNAEIASELFITESTVKYHVRNIRKKTDCDNRLEVTDLFIDYGR